jgi:hypothetical protein
MITTRYAGKIFEDRKTLQQSILGIDDGKEIVLQAVGKKEVFTSLDRPIFLQEFDVEKAVVGDKVEVILNRNATLGDLKQLIVDMELSAVTDLKDIGVAKGPTLKPLSPADAKKLMFKHPKLLDDTALKGPPFHLREGYVVVFASLAKLAIAQAEQSSPSDIQCGKASGLHGAARSGRGRFGKAQVPRIMAYNRGPEVALKIYTEEERPTRGPTITCTATSTSFSKSTTTTSSTVTEYASSTLANLI